MRTAGDVLLDDGGGGQRLSKMGAVDETRSTVLARPKEEDRRLSIERGDGAHACWLGL